ncbi:endonuclease/exonuclease/phosphatase family metal-dependent hydrolase [Ereboglobus sp. PH5-5]|uniref:endonuclease/exonuclease/phosphatase family protein n=1 Tax=unclassified Ereboglobus TaxID=2626932 RepID=UPI0024052332|nr:MULTISPECIES: endonuclease/exonuclease/phosphatase family protein [unclassified Ereboglobus]MDF9826973.1 endonuclease/exonuclease/phosphatase family metal-dependent hydrolase [Ereboglobus sp. PH5-10]MDF9831996.1 endonuclease/exonuclease/phosphatase family metal-dependent hydrolase [Ereboglobus sp. PH5-5]
MKTTLPVRRLTLLALASVALALTGFSEPVRVLTYNLLGSRPSTEKNAKCEPWVKRKPLVLEIMRDRTGGAGYDFIGTQETSTNPDPVLDQVNQLAVEMEKSGYGSLYAACNGEPNTLKPTEISMSNMFFWRKDRWEIDPGDSGTFWLSDTPEIPGSNTWSPIDPKTGKSTNKGARRNVSYGLFHEIANGKRTGKKVYFYNTHLNVHVPEARMKSALLIMDRIKNRKDKSAPIILTGDFNSLRNDSRGDGYVYKYLTGFPIKFEDVTYSPPQALVEAFEEAGSPREKLPRIDFIFSSKGLKPTSAANVDIRRNGIRPSDHAPIAAVLDWE